MSWTDERIATLRELWEQGLSASQIAGKLGNITRNAVIGKVHRLGLSGRPSPVRTDRAATPAAAPAAPVAVAPAAPAPQAPARPAEAHQPHILPAGPAPGAAPAPAARPVRLVTTTSADVAAQAAPKPRILPANPAPAERAPAPRAAAPAEPEPMVRATLLSINDRMCKWPVGDPGDAGFHFCGRRAQTGMPYCQDHARIAYQAATPKAREKRDRDRERERERLLRSLS